MYFLWLSLLSLSTAVVGGDVVGASNLIHQSTSFQYSNNQSYGSNYQISKYDDYFHIVNKLYTDEMFVADYDNFSITQTDKYQVNNNLNYQVKIQLDIELAPSEDNNEIIFTMSLECYKNINPSLTADTTNIYVDNIDFGFTRNNQDRHYYLPSLYSRVEFQQNGGSLFTEGVLNPNFVSIQEWHLNYDIHFLNDYYYDTFYDEGYDKGYSDAVNSDEVDYAKQQSYEQGYEQGKVDGVEEYKDSSEFEELIEQHEEWSYNTGYQTGYGEGLTASGSVAQMNAIFTGILDVGLMPVNFFLKILNFEVFGINIGGFVTGLFTLSIVVMLFRMFFGSNGGKDE